MTFRYHDYKTEAYAMLASRDCKMDTTIDLPTGWWVLLAGFIDAVKALNPHFSGKNIVQAKIKFGSLRIYCEDIEKLPGATVELESDINNLVWLLGYQLKFTCKTCGQFVLKQDESDYVCENCKYENPNNRYPHHMTKI